ncbi:hypothetical protein OG21DRAFT_1527693 [Imleria badia]|nr:hypothetical protein OG21DRAFT_1527693 [Imleria badia]
MLEHLDQTLLACWFQTPNAKLLVRPFDWKGKDPSITHPPLGENIRAMITDVASATNINLPSPLKISPPRPPSSQQMAMSNAFLVYDIPEQLAQTILAQRVWSTAKITFEAKAFAVTQLPPLLFTLIGFTILEVSTVHETVQRTWATQERCENIANIICTADPSFTSTIEHDRLRNAIQTFITTIQVEHVDIKLPGGVPALCFNIMTNNPPSMDPRAWTNLCISLSTLKYHSNMDSTGKSQCMAPCAICHSHTHLTGLCPFPAIPGWNGPTTRPKNLSPNRGIGHGRPCGTLYNPADHY